MKHCVVGGLVAILTTGGLIASAPASAGCRYGGLPPLEPGARVDRGLRLRADAAPVHSASQ